MPPLIFRLSYAGLLPFAAMALAAWFPDYSEQAKRLIVAYGACIVSFLGAVHWGIALQREDPAPASQASDAQSLRYIWAVLPSLMAWAALALPPQWGSLLVSLSLVLCWLVDQRGLRGIPHAQSYLRMRTRVTFLAWLCVVAARMAPVA